VGIGDVYSLMLETTRDKNIPVELNWEGKPHNQFAFIFMATGVFGILWFLIALIYPAWRAQLFRFLLFSLFMLLAAVSMLTLDTLESYDSVVFFAFFYSLFLCGIKNPET
jgi:hypothetical protein